MPMNNFKAILKAALRLASILPFAAVVAFGQQQVNLTARADDHNDARRHGSADVGLHLRGSRHRCHLHCDLPCSESERPSRSPGHGHDGGRARMVARRDYDSHGTGADHQLDQ